MIKRKSIISIFLVVFLVISTLFGAIGVRSYMLRQIAQERSSQLEEMLHQIQTNMDHGFETNWNLFASVKQEITSDQLQNEEEMCNLITKLEKIFNLRSYGWRLMLLEDTGVAYLSDGQLGYWDGVRFFTEGNTRDMFISDTSNIEGAHLTFCESFDVPISVVEEDFVLTHMVMLKDIETLKHYYTIDSYGGHATTYFFQRNGTLTYYEANDDTMDFLNIFQNLDEVKYIGDNSLEQVKCRLEADGIASADIMLEQTEYFYCITKLEHYDLYLMLLIPAKYVAGSTMAMMKSTLNTLIMFVLTILILMLLGFFSFVLRREAERERDAANVANEAKSSFLSNMSHDIRTPLSAVIGFATLALTHLEETERTRDYLNKILASSKHLLELIDDVLDMRRIESGKVKLEKTSVDLVQMIQNIRMMIIGQVREKQLDFFVDVMDVVNQNIYCDETRLSQVLLNLLSNAIKFTPSGGVISLRVSQHPEKEKKTALYEIRVKDTGIGIGKDFVKHIFEPFEREYSSAVSSTPGTGLGMTIAKNIIDMMGGTIEVISEPSRGTEIIVCVEFALVEKYENRKEEKQETSVCVEQFTGKKMLLVDDNDWNLEIAQEIFQNLGFVIDVAQDGAEAVDRIESERPGTYDLVVMDIQMPVMDGCEATKRIRAQEKDRGVCAPVPIIAMTANVLETDRRAALDSGMNGFICKPMVPQDVLRVLIQVLDKTSV